ncbi:MAG: AraC family transcriptional regulator [Opitutales bacterium]|nr:AraC family transcriptional regulator [Opitutales bacterium]
MRPSLELIEPVISSSFVTRLIDLPSFDHPLHFHPEIELTYILESEGERMIGDHVAPFQPGDLCLIGANLPHVYRNGKAGSGRARAEVLQFTLEGNLVSLAQMPEFEGFRQLLARAERGLSFSLAVSARAGACLAAIRERTMLHRWRAFIELIDILLSDCEVHELASELYSTSAPAEVPESIGRACSFIRRHYAEAITHVDMARSVGLAPAYFSRLFRANTRKTFSAFLNEVRLGQACRLLVETSATVTEIAFACGFNNLSNFNRRFREAYSCTPREYRSKVLRG